MARGTLQSHPFLKMYLWAVVLLKGPTTTQPQRQADFHFQSSFEIFVKATQQSCLLAVSHAFEVNTTKK